MSDDLSRSSPSLAATKRKEKACGLKIFYSRLSSNNFPVLHHMLHESISNPPLARLLSTTRIIRSKDEGQDVATPSSLPHLTTESKVHQISVSGKESTYRRALAVGHVVFTNPKPLSLIREHKVQKGDVLAVARVAAIMAVKKTSDIIPLTHGGVGVEGCIVDVELADGTNHSTGEVQQADSQILLDSKDEAAAKRLSQPIGLHGGIRIAVSVSTTAKTGAEMEALTGVVGAALSVVDMCKAVDRHLRIEAVEVVGKSGGKSGDWGVFALP